MIRLKVNGASKQFDGDPDMPVLWYVRDMLDMCGTKFGCGAGLCGACTVHINGVAKRSCVTTMKDVAGQSITTIEGLNAKGEHPLQKAWEACNVPQCGYCQSGQIMQAASLLKEHAKPTDQ
ncbi:MAG TPA: 2Fe-2S iron-sulfur cluster-binding protein, partial [Bryobacteraceae bacterium]